MAHEPQNTDHENEFLEPRLPIFGYVLLNLFVIGLCVLIWVATKAGWFSGVRAIVERPATASLLVFIPVAFLLASVYDYFFDVISNRRRLNLREQAVEEQAEEESSTKSRKSR